MTTPLSSSPRRLLARVRDRMAAEGAVQDRLNDVTTIIAGDLVSEVCSIYVRRAGDVLELFATHGLKASAVHSTRLMIGEGLIGTIAADATPLTLREAHRHPSFVFRPETGEDAFPSLAGVPILRGGRVVGVLAVQNEAHRDYVEEEVESLQTVAMVLAEIIAAGELVDPIELTPADGDASKPLRMEGARFSAGLGIGAAVVHQPQFTIEKMEADDVGAERTRLTRAFAEMHGALDAMLEQTSQAGGGEHMDVLETYRLIAEDAGWLAKIEDAIDGGLSAEAAVQKVQSDIRARFAQATDPYLRERAHDFEDLASRLLQHLLGETGVCQSERDDFVLVAHTMGPAQLLDYDHTKLRGLVLEEGSATSHVAIVARAFDIPVVGLVHGVLSRMEPGDTIVVDGDHAQVFLRPGEDVVQTFRTNIEARVRLKAEYEAHRDLPSTSTDGVDVSLNINAGLLVDFAQLQATGADGVGLYRTEVPFMVRSEYPGVDAQQTLYAKVYEHADGRPVTFRTLDIGGDKELPYWPTTDEENPAMGWRAIRVALDRPAILRQQLRAMIRAADGGELRVMFPMVAEVGEFEAAKALLDAELTREENKGRVMPSKVEAGVMLEVPALVLQLPEILKRVDFVSIGSNDLFQFVFATDRGNPKLTERYDTLSPAALSLLRTIREQCDAADVPVSICGEMAGRPLDAMALIALGYRRLSMSPPSVGPVKEMVRSLDVGKATLFLADSCDLSQHSLRAKLKDFAQDHGVTL